MILEQTSKERDELANTVIELEAALRSKIDELDPISSSSLIEDFIEESSCEISNDFEDESVVPQDKNGIWFSKRDSSQSRNTQENTQAPINIEPDMQEFQIHGIGILQNSDYSSNPGIEIGTQTDMVSNSMFTSTIEKFETSENSIIDNLTLDTAKLDELLNRAIVEINATRSEMEWRRWVPDNHFSQAAYHSSDTEQKRKLSPTLQTRIDMQSLKARFLRTETSGQRHLNHKSAIAINSMVSKSNSCSMVFV